MASFDFSSLPNVVAVNVVGRDGSGWGSGVVIGPHAILTAAHVITDFSINFNTRATASTIGIGKQVFKNDFSTATVASTLNYINQPGALIGKYDYAVIGVSADLSQYGAPMTVSSNFTSGTLHATGYPITFASVQTDNSFTGTLNSALQRIEYTDADIVSGNSGGPLWRVGASGAQEVYGVVSGGNSTTQYGVYFTPSVAAQINGWAAEANRLFANPAALPTQPANQERPSYNNGLNNLTGSFSSDVITGTPNRDFVIGGAGSDVISLGAGYDTVTYQLGVKADYRISITGRDANGVNLTVVKPDKSIDTISGVNQLKFVDGALKFDANGDASPLGVAIADQLFVVYLGHGVSQSWRNATAGIVENGPSKALLKSFYQTAISDGAFSAADSVQAVTNKTFLNIFGVNASTFEQNAWADTVAKGFVTREELPWAMFNSYLAATNVPPSYQIPAQSRLIAANAFSNSTFGAAESALSGTSGTVADQARAWLLPIRSQSDAAVKVVDAVGAVTRFTGKAGADVSAGLFVAASSTQGGPVDPSADPIPLAGLATPTAEGFQA